MDTDESVRQRRERLGGALECQQETTAKLEQLEKTAQAMARALEAIAQVLTGKRKGRINTGITRGRFAVYPDGSATPVPIQYPTEDAIADLLTEREQLQANLEQADAILAPYQKK